jgi:hypothetical protein
VSRISIRQQHATCSSSLPYGSTPQHPSLTLALSACLKDCTMRDLHLQHQQALAVSCYLRDLTAEVATLWLEARMASVHAMTAS